MRRQARILLFSLAFAVGALAGCGTSGTSTSAIGRPGLQELHDVGALRAAFNAAAGKPRLVLLLSPTCPTCVVGASWVQQHVLRDHPDADLSLIVVWLPQFPGDSRSRWDPSVLADRRVTHFWDQDSTSGHWFRDHVDLPYRTGPVLWDAYLLYGPDSEWGSVPDHLISTGRTVIGNTDQLDRDLAALLTG